MHAHTHPALFNRPIDDADLASRDGLRDARLRAQGPRQRHDGRAYHIQREFKHLTPIGGVVLNRSVGGLNPHVVQKALHYGAKVVWMPSNHSKYHSEYFDTPDYPQLGRKRKQLAGDGVTVFDERGQLKPEVTTICELVAEDDACLATGHLSIEETRALQAEAKRCGVSKLLVTHANWALTRYELDVQRELIAEGAYLEYVAVSCVSPIFWEQKPDELAEWIGSSAATS